MKAPDFLRKSADLLEERGKEYDKPEGERSMARTVAAFENITGKWITESEGWLFMQILKDVRQWQNPDKYHADSAEDCVSYAALKAEALASAHSSIDAVMNVSVEKSKQISERGIAVAASMDDDSPRMQAIGQNGNDGLHYAASDEWIFWAGDERPVVSGILLDIVFSDGTKQFNTPAQHWCWGQDATPKITAYRLAKES